MKFIMFHCTESSEDALRAVQEWKHMVDPLKWFPPPVSALRMLSCIRHTNGNKVTLKLCLRTHAAE